VLSTGQKAQFTGTQDLLIRQPNGLRAEISVGAQHRLWFYDGKKFTLYADGPGYYATVPAPSNLRELADTLQHKFAIEMPLRDLFLWAPIALRPRVSAPRSISVRRKSMERPSSTTHSDRVLSTGRYGSRTGITRCHASW